MAFPHSLSAATSADSLSDPDDLGATASTAPMSSINVIPLVDVMLVLLVIFIITAPLFTSVLPLSLPQSATAQANTTAQSVLVAIDANQRLYWDGALITEARLAQNLRTQAQHNPQTEVQVRADSQLAYGNIVRLMDLIQTAGLSRVGFVVVPPPSP